MGSIVHCYVGCNAGSDDLQALHVLECDTETGAAKIVQSVKGVQETTYFQLDWAGRNLYTVIGERRAVPKRSFLVRLVRAVLRRIRKPRTRPAVVRFPVMADGRLGAMRRVADLPCEAPCHVSLTPDGKRVAFAAYLSATAGTVRIDGKHLRTFVFPDDEMGPNAKRQQKAYAHQTFYTPDGRLGVVDLGCDRIWFFDLVTMARDATLSIKADPGDGPRHAIWSKDGRFLFVLNELGSSVTSFEFRDCGLSDGRAHRQFRRIGKWTTLPEGFDRWETDGETLSTKAAAIKLTEDGKVLMASNRGHDSIAFFDVKADGSLALRNIAKLTGRFPRDFELMPGERFMVVGHKMSNEIQIYRFDRAACTLTPAGDPLPVWRPLCFKFAR